ncbi:flagellar hook-basal body complex protein [Roseicyclus mahoneyensis]|uniref:Flagellar basal-body rod protein FlgF n=1 Tax=Roseicyclus mahoneyensis TaxID=164332 RepID=A0A316GGT2_9RHOB|nr:flagellar hook-basal body complex protein [Roseicyclus mahoneyensis]PWK59798.1 flagellar basal-body rod protein FlgF [Roseicyclus mahoneyensis]
MDNATYTTLTRQSGLLTEMQVVAHNIANMATAGYRAEGVVFAEHVRRLEGETDSLSMAHATGRAISAQQGALDQTGSPFHVAIEGEGFFLVQTPEGEALTRAGNFVRTAFGELATPDGHMLLDAGGAQVFVPPDAASITIAQDGTLSADGQPVTQIGLWQPVNPIELTRRAGVLFTAESGVEPAQGGILLQGMVERSNVDPIVQIARMIEVQRAYELGASFLDAEDQRVRDFLRTAGARQ